MVSVCCCFSIFGEQFTPPPLGIIKTNCEKKTVMLSHTIMIDTHAIIKLIKKIVSH